MAQFVTAAYTFRTVKEPEAMLTVISFSILAWALEAAAVWAIARAVGIDLAVSQTMVVLGAASLSTIVPTAPGYLGSYQFVFAVTFSIFGLPEASGIVVATAIQIFLFGTVTASGLILLVLRSAHSGVTGHGDDHGIGLHGSGRQAKRWPQGRIPKRPWRRALSI